MKKKMASSCLSYIKTALETTVAVIFAAAFYGSFVLMGFSAKSIYDYNNKYHHDFVRFTNCSHVKHVYQTQCSVQLNCGCFLGLNNFYPSCSNVLNGSCLLPPSETCRVSFSGGRTVDAPQLCVQYIGMFCTKCSIVVDSYNFSYEGDLICQYSNITQDCGMIGQTFYFDDPNRHFHTYMSYKSAIAGIVVSCIVICFPFVCVKCTEFIEHRKQKATNIQEETPNIEEGAPNNNE